MKHFKYLSQWKKATAVGSPKLSARLICGLLNALIEAGSYFEMLKQLYEHE